MARASCIDPRLMAGYQAAHGLPALPVLPATLPAGQEAQSAVAVLLSGAG